MAKSYAANVVPYLDAMLRADPSAQIGVPWAFSGDEAQGAGVTDAAQWNRAVLHAVRGRASFVDAHWYPFDSTAGITDQQIVASATRIPRAAAQIRSTLQRDDPGASFVVGETNISERLTTLDFQPVSALFAATTSLEWLAHGAESVDWWDLNNFGSLSTGDYGMVSSGATEPQPEGTPLPAYYGEQLASQLTGNGSRLDTVATGSPTLLGFESNFQNLRRVLVANSDPNRAATIRPSWFAAGSKVHVQTYSAATAGAPDPIVRTTVSSGGQLSLPAMSLVVLSGTPGS
jgi:hypothetical protein